MWLFSLFYAVTYSPAARVATATGLALIVLGLCSQVRAHYAQSGWEYPLSCCSASMDCYEIDESELELIPGGWRIKATGEIRDQSQVKDSPDGRYHRCSVGGDRKNSTICLFIPPHGA